MFGGTMGRRGGIIFALGGLALLALALRSARDAYTFVQTVSRAEGLVTGLNAGGSHPQVNFTAPANGEISIPQGGFIGGYRRGDKVQVLFDPGNPAGTATIDAFGAVWFWPLLLGGIGAVFLVGGTVTWLSSTGKS
jgi:Protein of unknown function (DUF3592)